GWELTRFQHLFCDAALLAADRAVVRAGDLGFATAFEADLVQPVGQPLGEPARVGEDDGRAMRIDEVEDALLDVRPDRALGLFVVDLVRRLHVFDGHDNADFEGLGRRWLHDRGRPRTAEKPGDFVYWPHRRRKPDPLRRPVEQGV